MKYVLLLISLFAAPAMAADDVMNPADVAWMLTSTTLVLFMTIPGIALFYAGMVRKKNVLSVVMQSFAICCSLTIVWYVLGYSLAFSEGNFFVGGFSKVFLKGLDINTMQGSIPELLFMMFQMTFALLTPALMCGAFAERMKFSALFLFMVLWSIFCYAPICHWVWAEDGWLCTMGALDYAGGTVVHINAGIAGLVAITPGSGFVEPAPALLIGICGGVICYFGATLLKYKLNYDDSLDAFGVHGIGGIVGALLTGVFATAAVTGEEMNPMLEQLWIQFISVIATLVYAAIVTFILLKLVDFLIGLRVTSEEERTGLDLSLHGERVE